MGLDRNGTRFLLHARKSGVSFARTAMIGRQQMLISPHDLVRVCRDSGLQCDAGEAGEWINKSDGFAEGFLTALGAASIVSFDVSEYEGASVIHDLNLPTPAEYDGRFTAVLDGGTLEHVFNFPAAIASCMKMVAVGGHFLAITPTNNHSGHGFYQFSPELFFRIFSDENGFELTSMIAYEEPSVNAWFSVTDPDAVRERVTITNSEPTMLALIAKKTREMPVFVSPPYQSDYVTAWQQTVAAEGKGPRLGNVPFAERIRDVLAGYRQLVGNIKGRRSSLHRRPKHFKEVK